MKNKINLSNNIIDTVFNCASEISFDQSENHLLQIREFSFNSLKLLGNGINSSTDGIFDFKQYFFKVS